MKHFNDNIKRIIEKFAYDFYIVQQDFNIMCTCIEFSTKQPNPACPKCLGTGRKIKIKKIRGASEDDKGSFRNMSLNESSFMRSYYIDAKYPIYEQNIIVDNDEVLIAHRIEEKKTANREIVYRKAFMNKKKSHTKEFLRNFYRVVKGGR